MLSKNKSENKLSIHIPDHILAAVDKATDMYCETRAGFLRRIIVSKLRDDGFLLDETNNDAKLSR